MDGWKHSFGFVGVALLVASFFTGNHTVDIHLHDTYYVIATRFLLATTGGWSLLCWLLYQLLRKRSASAPLTVLHVVLSLLFVVVLFVVPLLFRSSPRRYVDLSSFRNGQRAIVLATLGFVLGQVLFFANTLLALVGRGRK